MTMQRARVSTTRAVQGEDWIAAGRVDVQEMFWVVLRRRFQADLLADGWQLVEEPRETTEYDEEHGRVLLHIRAVGEREVGCSPDEAGWQIVGHINGPIELKGPPAGRDRFA